MDFINCINTRLTYEMSTRSALSPSRSPTICGTISDRVHCSVSDLSRSPCLGSWCFLTKSEYIRAYHTRSAISFQKP